MRAELQSALNAARNLPADELPRLLGDLEELRAVAFSRLTSPSLPAAPDTLLGVDDAAVRMGMSPGYLYRHHADFPFSRRIGRRLLFSSRGIDEYLRRRR